MIENGRRQVSVDELLTLATALNVSPLHLIVPLGDVDVAIGEKAYLTRDVRAWIRGARPLDDDDSTRTFLDYIAEMPEPELREKIKSYLTKDLGRLDLEFVNEVLEERASDIAWEIQEGEAIREAEARAERRRTSPTSDNKEEAQ